MGAGALIGPVGIGSPLPGMLRSKRDIYCCFAMGFALMFGRPFMKVPPRCAFLALTLACCGSGCPPRFSVCFCKGIGVGVGAGMGIKVEPAPPLAVPPALIGPELVAPVELAGANDRWPRN